MDESPNGRLERTFRVDRDRRIEEVRIQAEVRTELDGQSSSTALTVGTEDTQAGEPYTAVLDDETGTGGEWETRNVTLRNVSAGELKLGLVASGGATLEVDSLEVAYDTDGDGLTDNQETEGITNGLGDTIETDRTDEDTDDDGIPDGEEVGNLLEVTALADDLPDGIVQRSYYPTESDPTATDSDGDGLTDYEETNEKQQFRYTPAPGKTKAVIEAQANGEDPLQYFAVGEKSTSPYYADTDFDGLDDGREAELMTNPTQPDTDGDGIGDAFERAVGEDPTLFDASAPTVSVYSVRAEGDVLTSSATYTVRFRVHDPSGVDRAVVSKGGGRTVADLRSGPTNTRVLSKQVTSSGYWAYVFEKGTLGPSVTIDVEDSHGNDASEAYSGPSTYARFAEFLGNLPGAGVQTAHTPTRLTVFEATSLFAGFMYGVGSSARGFYDVAVTVSRTPAILRDLVRHPQQLVDAVATVIEIGNRIAARPELLEGMAESAVEAVAATQRIQNPFDPGDVRYDAFRTNWYAGFLAGHAAVEVGVSLGVGFAVKRLENTFDTVEAVTDAVRSARAMALAGTVGVAARMAGLVARGIVRGTVLSIHGVRAGLQRVSVARQFVTARVMRGLSDDPDLADEIARTRELATDGGEAFDESLIGLIAVSGDDARQLIQALSSDPDLLDWLVADETSATTQRVLARALASGDVDGADVRRMAFILKNKDTSPFFDSEVTASDLRRIAARNGDPSEMLVVVKPRDSVRPVWLEEGLTRAEADALGRRPSGWKHILEDHETQFYDISSISTRDGIKRSIYATVKRGDTHSIPVARQGGTAYEFQITPDKRMTVIVGDNGYVVTARPGGYP